VARFYWPGVQDATLTPSAVLAYWMRGSMAELPYDLSLKAGDSFPPTGPCPKP
jgi:hypothetical protein